MKGVSYVLIESGGARILTSFLKVHESTCKCRPAIYIYIHILKVIILGFKVPCPASRKTSTFHHHHHHRGPFGASGRGNAVVYR